MKNKILLTIFAILVFSNLVLAAGTISGYVKDINGNSLANATVITNIIGFSNSATTDATGFYNLTVTTTPAIYNLTANLTNYATPSTLQKLIQTNQETHQNFTLTASSGTIAINVKNNTLNNLAGAGINVFNSVNSLVYTGSTDINGNLNIILSAGNYNVSASASGYYDNSALATLTLGNTTNVNIILSNIPPIPPTPPGSPNGGGGGGGGGGCTPKWNCTEWNSCNKNGNQTRICTDLRDCFNSDNKPLEVQSCAYLECTKDSDCLSGYECSSNKCTKKIIIENKTATQETEEITETNAITGFSILDYAKKLKDSKAATIVLAVFLGILSGVAVFIYLRRKY